MATINTTPNLHLPQWTADEKPTWLVDMNGAFSGIDTAYGLMSGDIASLRTDDSAIKSDIAQLEGRVSNNEQAIIATNNNLNQTVLNIIDEANKLTRVTAIPFTPADNNLISNVTVAINQRGFMTQLFFDGTVNWSNSAAWSSALIDLGTVDLSTTAFTVSLPSQSAFSNASPTRAPIIKTSDAALEEIVQLRAYVTDNKHITMRFNRSAGAVLPTSGTSLVSYRFFGLTNIPVNLSGTRAISADAQAVTQEISLL